ncbi:MAG: HAMP domain-containing sensor histidine kinase [Longimicrobiales bacterium]
MRRDLSQLRLRLTIWYIAVFAAVLVAFAFATLFVTTREISRELDRSLASSVDAVIAAVQTRDRTDPAESSQLGALNALHIPGRNLYVFDISGRPLHPDTANDWLRGVARRAASAGVATGEADMPEPLTAWRVHARRFVLGDGRTLVGAATADVIEVEDRYPNVVNGFAAAAVLALILCGAGGWLLAQRSIRPVEEAFLRMRQFMADAAHELRTPVAVVKGHAEVALRRPRDGAEYVDALRAIHAEAGRLAGVLENVLVIARADAGAWPVAREALYLDDILMEATDAARVLAESRDISVTIDQLDELPVRGDPALLRQLMMILLDNAVKFSPAGGRVNVSVTRSNGNGVLSVLDAGPGIPAGQVEHLFEPFTRGEHVRESTGGAGLGLSIARWIAELHNATIEVVSPSSGGTDMRVLFQSEAAST